MSDNTKIEWCDATWNPITGCSVVSPGCTNCYAMQLAGTRLKHTPSREGLTKCVNGNHVWNGEVRLNENTLDQPLKWKRPRKIFVCAHGDLFHENVPFEWIDKVFAIMALCPHHTFIVLTKRAARMREYIKDKRDLVTIFGVGRIFEYQKVWPLQNLWLGVSVENQETANERIPVLLDTPAAVRFISAEPLLGAINLQMLVSDFDTTKRLQWRNGLKGVSFSTREDRWVATNKLDWVIVGGESGKNARPMDNNWVIKLVKQCSESGVPIFIKQLSSGNHRPIININEFPLELQFREYPYEK